MPASQRGWLSPYPHPVAATMELVGRARGLPEHCQVEQIGVSSQGRPVFALHISATDFAPEIPRVLVTGQIHAAEFVAGFVVRALAEVLLAPQCSGPQVQRLLRSAVVCLVPLLNPDGAERVWHRQGWVGFAGSRVTANGVDPNRNFPFVPVRGRRGWNSSSQRRGSPFYRGPYPLSEPECLALARLCRREKFCAALNFHSFGGVLFFPAPSDAELANVLYVFRTVFPEAQRYCRYRCVPEPWSALAGQLDLFLWHAFGTPSVTVEVGKPGKFLALRPHRWLHFFSWANPPNPTTWADNDVPAAVSALLAMLERTRGRPLPAQYPQLAEQVP